MVQTAARTGTQVIWDLMHFGWPNDLDPLGPEFVPRFARYARACATMLAGESDAVPWYVPVNEISFLAWGGGDAAWINPYMLGRGFEFKVQLCRAAIAAIEAIRDVQPHARIATAEPVINVVPMDVTDPAQRAEAEGHRQAQFQAWDMLSGRLWPQVGGDPKYLDVIGVNFYYNNQRVHGEGLLTNRSDSRYRPFRAMLAEVHARYGRPLFIAETGIEGEAHVTGIPRYQMPLAAHEDARPEWLRYVCAETRAAQSAGVPVEGICLYPVLNHLGWGDDRHCQNGLLDFVLDDQQRRGVISSYAAELARQQALFEPPPAALPHKEHVRAGERLAGVAHG
jgi:beta-glucosidase/6-phospho-beta-glucosidase/beta-galactosidase